MTASDSSRLWNKFAQESSLTEAQLEKFKRYYELLIEWNSAICNLTTITEASSVIRDHFQDSLSITECVDFSSLHSIADIGTGAGFPGIPLKILFPHLTVYLIEVTQKKREFLAHVIEQLDLSDMVLVDLDWRSFLRTTNYAIDLFVSRAALAPLELMRMYRSTCPYNKQKLVYWASRDWQASVKELSFIKKEWQYLIGSKKRRLIFF
jgi:16S rRNA (guanine(527)-N(7))-methyltransferase RsmG